MQEQEQLITVIIRSTGRQELTQALDSIARQKYRPLEIVLVDAIGEGLPSASLEDVEVRSVGAGHKLGRSQAANIGLESARGEAILFLDDDDWLHPDHIHALAQKLAMWPKAVAAYAGVRCVQDNANGKNTQTVRLYNDDFDPVRLLVENYIPINALLFRRAVLESPAYCRFDESIDLYEDWDFWLQLQNYGEFVHHPEITAFYRIHLGGGEGVRADQDRALSALDRVLAKWRMRWTSEQLRSLIARDRLLAKLLGEQNSLIDKQSHELLQMERRISQSESEITEINDQLSLKNIKINALQDTLAEVNAELSNQNTRYDSLQHTLAEVNAELSNQNTRYDALQLTLADRETQLTTAKAWRVEIESTMAYRMHRKLQFTKARISLAASLIKEGQTKELLWRILRKSRTLLLARLPSKMIPFWLKQRLRGFLFRELASPKATKISSKFADNKLVSILVPVYQHTNFLEQCVKSALEQTYDHVEVIVVDDASPDPLVQKILQGLSDNPRLHLYKNPTNLGIAATQNNALLASQGAIIGFLDCDDYLAPEAVEISLKHWKKDTVYSHTARINVDKDNQEVSRVCFHHLPRSDYFSENLEAMYATHFKMIRRDVFSRLGLFDSRFDTAQDYDYLMRVAAHYQSKSFTYIPHFVYYHRMHSNQTTEKANLRQTRAVALIQREAILRREIQTGKFDKMLSFIMLSFGKHSQTLEAIISLVRTVQVTHEIILLDNGSDQETVEFIKQRIDGHFENLRVFYSDRNLGPAAGRREALRHAKGDWFIVFDNDEIAEPGWLEELLVRASSDPNIGAVTCKVIFPNHELQCCGGYIEYLEDDIIDLKLYGRGINTYDLASAQFRDCDWCPIGATLFTRNPTDYLHAGYPNIFEDAGVSMALLRQGLRLVNSPASWVWHEHVTFKKTIEMGARYTQERYDPKRMLISVASFYRENGLIIYDEYVWRENHLNRNNIPHVRALLEDIALRSYPV